MSKFRIKKSSPLTTLFLNVPGGLVVCRECGGAPILPTRESRQTHLRKKVHRQLVLEVQR